MAASGRQKSLTSHAWLSIAAALTTMALKTIAWQVTGSVGFLSDALESIVNLVAAITVLIVLVISAREPDEEHAYGHSKAEYFGSGFEGGLIFLAALGIFYSAIPRLFNPQPLESIGIGLALTLTATVVNILAGFALARAARKYRSIALESDAKHLFTDVWTSIGVATAVVLVGITGWDRLDAIIAIIVGLHILGTGFDLVRKSVNGLLDASIPDNEMSILQDILDRYRLEQGVLTHAVRTRQAGQRRFVSMHVLVPGSWTVTRGHDLVMQLEADIREELPDTTTFTHLEPVEHPESWSDTGLDG